MSNNLIITKTLKQSGNEVGLKNRKFSGEKGENEVSAVASLLDIKQYNTEVKPLTMIQLAFVSAYIANGGNGTQAAKEAGYKCKSDNAFARQA